MKTVKAYPPNFDTIRAALPHADAHASYCYGDTIYVPDGHELPPDIFYHETIHSRQQGDNPAGWWYRYVTDPTFRREQEIAAYGEQYLFAKRNIEDADGHARAEGKVLAVGKNNLLKFALEQMASALSGKEYGPILAYGEAVSKIRNYGKASQTEENKEAREKQRRQRTACI